MIIFDQLLKENMTNDGYIFWKKLESKIPNIWNRLSSSSKKYHLNENGEVQSIGIHTYEMLYAAINSLSLLNVKIKTKESDLIILAIVLHDSAKYGIEDPLTRKHTDSKHDHIIGDLINLSRNTFMKYFTNEETNLLEEMVRYHSGRWSTDLKKSNIKFESLNIKTIFVHFLDMLSSRNLLKLPK